MTSAYDRVEFRGVVLNRRTKRMLEWVEEQVGFQLQLSQGSYTNGAFSGSGSTHDKGGAVDIRTSVLTTSQRKAVVKACKRAGFAAWFRGPNSGFSPHVHAIAHGDKQRSTSARWQCEEYDQGRSGLTGGGADRTWRTPHPVVFSYKRRRPVPRD